LKSIIVVAITLNLWNFETLKLVYVDEYNRGMDPEVKIYFRKIIKSFVVGMVWFLFISTLAFSFKMAYIKESVSWQNIVFYVLLLITLTAMIYYLLKVWKKDLSNAN
jgi:ABC-type spermidine/putrescine transport system permease subunit I